MIQLTQLTGAIFDVDDTLLDNHPGGIKTGLHERSRLLATHEVGRRYNSAGLQKITREQNRRAFLEAPVHTLHAAIWQTLVIAGEVVPGEIEPDHPLLLEIVKLKDELHEELLRTKGREVKGASKFVRRLAAQGLGDKMAIASTAYRRDIDVFLEMTKLDEFFPHERIISRENITYAKPHSQPFNLAFATLGLPEAARGEVLVVEDDPRGIMSAKAAGLFTCAIATRYDKRALAALEVSPDLVVTTFAELEAALGAPAGRKV